MYAPTFIRDWIVGQVLSSAFSAATANDPVETELCSLIDTSFRLTEERLRSAGTDGVTPPEGAIYAVFKRHRIFATDLFRAGDLVGITALVEGSNRLAEYLDGLLADNGQSEMVALGTTAKAFSAALQASLLDAFREYGTRPGSALTGPLLAVLDWKQQAALGQQSTATDEIRAQITRLAEDLAAVEAGGHPRLEDLVDPPFIGGSEESALALINARRSTVPYQDPAEFHRLLSWCTSPGSPPTTAALIGGGGAGKTRLAVELAKHLAGDGWLVGFIRRRTGGQVEDGLADAVRRADRPTLLVVDYAEATDQDALADLWRAVEDTDEDGQRVRLLLTSRESTEWLRQLRDRVLVHSKDGSGRKPGLVEVHGPIATADLRERIAAATRHEFSLNSDHGLVGDNWTIVDLVLALALIAAGDAKRIPKTRSELYRAVLKHEAKGWSTESRLALHRPGWTTLAATLTLFAPSGRREALELLTSLSVAATEITASGRSPDDVLESFVTRWGVADEAGAYLLAPALRPDRLGEFLVATQVASDPEWLAASLAWADAPGRAAQASAMVQMLGRAFGTVDPRSRNGFVAAALDLDSLGSTDSGMVLSAIRDEAGVGNRFAVAVATQLSAAAADDDPRLGYLASLSVGRSPALAALRANYAARSADLDSPDEGARAAALNNLGALLSEAGRRADALAPTEEAVNIYRRLANTAPEAYLPDLAGSLSNLGIRLSEAGRRADALAPTGEAVNIYRRLANTAPEAYLPNLAGSLSNLGIRLSEAGRRADALAPTEEAVNIYRRLAETAPEAYLPALAGSLNNLGIRLSEAGRRADALAPTEEAVNIYRRLANTAPEAYLPNLAASLNNLGVRLSEAGRRADALAPTEEAVNIRRRLAETAPEAYLPDLAGSLNNLGIRLSEAGRRADALAPTEEAVNIYRRLAETAPEAYLPNLAMSLNNLGVRLSAAGRRADALAPTQEAVNIYRRLANTAPEAYLPDLAASLNNLGARLSEAGRRADALAPTEEAVNIRRRLADTAPEAYLPDLAMSLNNLGALLSEAGRRADALAPTEEAVNIRRRLAETAPEAYLPDLAMSLNNLGALLSEAGRRADALAPTEEAVNIRRRLAETAPEAYLPDLAMSLNNLGALLSEAGRRADALAPTEEAVNIRRRLAETAPEAYLPDLAMSLNNLGALLSEAGRRADALAPTQEAVNIYRRLAETAPEAYLPALAMSSNNLGIRLSEAGRRADALAPTQEAVNIYRRLANTAPEAYLPALAASLNNLGNRLSEAGRRADALAPTQEAVNIRRRLANTAPEAYLPALAASLNNLGNRLSEAGRRADALAPTQEAVNIYRRLANTAPEAYLPALAASLNNLGNRLSEAGRRADALAPTQEAVNIRRRLANTAPEAYLPALAASLNNLGNRLSEAGRRAEVLAAWLNVAERLGGTSAGWLLAAGAASARLALETRAALAASATGHLTDASAHPHRVGEARRTLRSVAAELGQFPADPPRWLSFKIDERTEVLARAWDSAPHGALAEVLSADDLDWEDDTVLGQLDAVAELWPASRFASEWERLRAEGSVPAAIEQRVAIDSTIGELRSWFTTNTWEASRAHLSERREVLDAPLTRQVLQEMARRDQTAAYHLHLLRLLDHGENPERVFAAAADSNLVRRYVLQATNAGDVTGAALWLQLRPGSVDELCRAVVSVAAVAAATADDRFDSDAALALLADLAQAATEDSRRATVDMVIDLRAHDAHRELAGAILAAIDAQHADPEH